MKITVNMMYDILIDEWNHTKGKIYQIYCSENIEEIKKLVRYLEALDTLLKKYEGGCV